MKSRVWEYAPVKYEGTAPYDKFFNIFFCSSVNWMRNIVSRREINRHSSMESRLLVHTQTATEKSI